MSSEMSRFVLPPLSLAEPPGRHRLHSRLHAFFARSFAVLLAAAAFQHLWYALHSTAPATNGPEPPSILPQLVAMLAVATYIWFRPKPVYASKAGLEIGSGKKRRLIPWSHVLDIREMPTVRLSWFSKPSMWQVDLQRDERFDFCGSPNAQKIVKEYVAQAERDVQ